MQPSCSSADPTYSSRHGAQSCFVTRALLSRIYEEAEHAATVREMRKIALAGLLVVFAATIGASSVRADHDPANECLGRTQTIRGTPGNDVLTGLAGDDTIDGGGGRDVLCGEEGNDTLTGADGDDSLDGGQGDDRLDGGNGLDLAFWRWSIAPVQASLLSNTATGEGNDTMTAIEGLSGSRLDDTLTGDDGDNLLDGLGGNDVLSGGRGIDGLDGDAGNDVLDGGPGRDRLVGGPGRDRADGGSGRDRCSAERRRRCP